MPRALRCALAVIVRLTRARLMGAGPLGTGLAAIVLAGAAPALGSEPVSVVASIKPVHSLVSAVMAGVGTPHLLIKGGASPHTYSLRPSDAQALERATVVFWIGEDLELSLAPAVRHLAADARLVTLSEAPCLTRLRFREGGSWEAHEHGGAHEIVHEDHDDDHHHGHREWDTHIWLDPANAAVMVREIVRALDAVDPGNRAIYEQNGDAVTARLTALKTDLAALLIPVADRPFILFHDAFQYLEHSFSLEAVGSVTVSPERAPGAERLKQLQAKIAALGAVCVFVEPQFSPKLVDVVTEGTDARIGVLDPLGADIADGPELYFELMRRNAAALRECLSG